MIYERIIYVIYDISIFRGVFCYASVVDAKVTSCVGRVVMSSRRLPEKSGLAFKDIFGLSR